MSNVNVKWARIDIEAHTRIFKERRFVYPEHELSDEELLSITLSVLAELKRCYEKIDEVNQLVCCLDELLDTDNMTFSEREEIGDALELWRALTYTVYEG